MASFFNSEMIKRHFPLILLLACLSLAYLVYLPGLGGYFLFDDTINIVENENLRIRSLDLQTLKKAALSGDAGKFGRPVSVLSFALNYYIHGLDPYYLKFTNVIIHLLNGICIFALSWLLLNASRRHHPNALDQNTVRWISLLIAAAWVFHPLNLTGVLYIVQRMTSLSSLFTLLGLIFYVRGRSRMLEGQSGWMWIAISILVFGPLAAFSKENGALLPLFLFLTELVFFRFEAPSARSKHLLTAIFYIIVFLPCAALFVYTAIKPTWITAAYDIRDFNLVERLLTEARVLWVYIRLAIAPDITLLGMYHDDILISKNLFDPLTTLPAAASVLLLGLAAVFASRRYPIASFGILFYLIGHSMESSVLALELVHEHRNYLPIFGLLLPLFYYLLCPSAHAQSLNARRTLAACLVLLFAGVTFVRATQWGDAVLMKEKEVEHHPESIRANMDIGAFYAATPATSPVEAEEFYRNAYTYYAKASSLSPNDTLGLFGLIRLQATYSLPVEESWTPVLAKRIEHHPFAPSTGNSLVNLQRCVLYGNCRHLSENLEILFEAALRNPTLRGKAKSQVLFAWSDFLFRDRNRLDDAVNAAFQAAAINPTDLDAQITLITLLINMGKDKEARDQIDQFRKIDQMGLRSTEISDLEKTITKKS